MFQRPSAGRAFQRNLVLGLDHARTKIADWVGDNIGQRPHSSPGYLTPAANAAYSPQRTVCSATPTSSAEAGRSDTVQTVNIRDAN